MTESRPDPLLRLGSTSEAIHALRDIFAGEEPLDEALARVAAAAARALPDAHAVTITVISGQRSRLAACTEDTVRPLVHRQYKADRGPALESARRRRTIRAEVGEHPERWPEFEELARRIGIRAYLCLPLLEELEDIHDGKELIGSLNIYSRTASAFDRVDEVLMGLYSAAAGQTIVNAHRWRQTRETVTQLEQALVTRAEIDQAKGALIAMRGCTADEAFASLSEQSQRENIKVHTLARQLLESLQNKRPGP